MPDHTASFVSHSFTHIIFSIPQDRAGQRSSYLEWSNEPSHLTWSPSEASHQQQGEEDRSYQRERRNRPWSRSTVTVAVAVARMRR